MTPILLGEYRNENSRRHYPFADDVSLRDADGNVLSNDFLIDAFLYPIDMVGIPYMSKIDTDEHLIYISDSGTGLVVGVAEYDLAEDHAYVYEDMYERQIGVLVFGSGLSTLFMGRAIREFTAEATPLCPTTYIPLNQLGVRGVVLPDGTLITGDIIFAGENGVEVTNTGTTLRIDLKGVMLPSQDECGDDCPVITELCFHRLPGSLFHISQYTANTLAITTSDFSQEDICAAQKARTLPDVDGNLPMKPKTGDSPCEPAPTPPTPPVPGDEELVCYVMSDIGGKLYIIAPSAVGYTNPVSVKELEGMVMPRRLIQKHPVSDVSKLDKLVNEFRIPPLATEGIELGFKGLRQYDKGVLS